MSTAKPISSIQEQQAIRASDWGRILVGLIILGMVFLLGRVVQLKVKPDPRLAPALGSYLSNRVEMARRGDLLDRMGRVIATSSVGYRLFVDPSVADDADTVALDLGRALQMDPIAIDRAIVERPESRYVVIDHELDEWQVERINKANLKGVGLEPRLVRAYPQGDLAAGIVGKVGFEHTGQGGFEMIFNKGMLPTFGRLTFLRDVGRRALWIDPADYSPGHDGKDVRLSIDLAIQEIAERHLHSAIKEFNAGGGRLVVIDCQTGEILAMTDVLNPRKGWKEQTEDPLRTIHPALGRNRCVTDPYEPGSTFKPFIWAVATELNKADPNEILPLPEGPWRTPYGRMIHDAHYYGPSSWYKVLVKSMNTGMAMVAERMTHRQMQDAIRRFGFGQRTYCGLPGESPGMVTSPKKWKKYTQSSVAYGHEIAVTPLQMVRAFSAFARDGTMAPLRITALDQGSPAFPDNTAETRKPRAESPYKRAIPQNIVTIAREAMKGVMEEGTGRQAQSKYYQIFGKSGTAQLTKRGGKGYWDDRYVASFIAGAPFNEPRIVVLCVLDDPDKRKGHFGGAIAGPVVRNVIDDTLSYLGVAPDQPADVQALAKVE